MHSSSPGRDNFLSRISWADMGRLIELAFSRETNPRTIYTNEGFPSTHDLFVIRNNARRSGAGLARIK